MTGRRVVLALFALTAAGVSSLAAQSVRLSRGYLTSKDVSDPAVFSVQRGDSTWLTKFDGAVVVAASGERVGLPDVTFEGGYYASIGTLRNAKARVHGPWGGVTVDVCHLLLDTKMGWEVTEDSKTRTLTGTVRISPLTWRATGVGVPILLAEWKDGGVWRPHEPVGAGTYAEVSWRPYIGYQIGTLQKSDKPMEVAEGQRFERYTGSVDVLFRVIRVVRYPEDTATKFQSRLELSAKAVAWWLKALGETRTQFLFGIALPISDNAKLKLDWEEARKPPAFRYEQSIVLGVGVVW
jgi:hypothetical protein